MTLLKFVLGISFGVVLMTFDYSLNSPARGVFISVFLHGKYYSYMK